MFRRSICVALFVLLASTGCSSWKSIQEKDTGAIDGQSKFIVAPLAFAQIEEVSEEKWLSDQDEDQKKAWPSEKEFIQKAFLQELKNDLEGRVQLTTSEAPEGAKITLKPVVTELGIGGYYKGLMVISVQVIDAQTGLLEEITTKAKVRGGDFKDRLAAAAEETAENVAKYVRKRTGK